MMGAFWCDFRRLRSEMAGEMYGFTDFKAAAYWLCPCGAEEVFTGCSRTVACVAPTGQLGGFVFGGLIAVGLRESGQQNAEKGIQENNLLGQPSLLAEDQRQLENGAGAAESNLKALLLENRTPLTHTGC